MVERPPERCSCCEENPGEFHCEECGTDATYCADCFGADFCLEHAEYEDDEDFLGYA